MGKLDWRKLALAIPTVLRQFAEELHQTCEDGQDTSTKSGAHRAHRRVAHRASRRVVHRAVHRAAARSSAHRV